MEEKLLSHVRMMKPRDHCMFFYENRENKRLILFTFLKFGLEKREAAIYVAGDESTRAIKKAMKDLIGC